jgi:hypothetical protein
MIEKIQAHTDPVRLIETHGRRLPGQPEPVIEFHAFTSPFVRIGIPPKHTTDLHRFPPSLPVCEKLSQTLKKELDKAGEIGYIIGALRRQQVGFPVNPAEDNNDPNMIVFVPFCLFAEGFSF